MPQTESQRRASLKYVKDHVKRRELRFYPSELELFEFAKKIGSSEIKELIRERAAN